MRPADFRLEVWGFVVPLNLGQHVVVRVSCGVCGKEVAVSEPTALLGPVAYDFAHDLRAVREHYDEKHGELQVAVEVGS